MLDKNKSGKKMSDDEIKKEKGGKEFLARIKAAKEKMKKEETELEKLQKAIKTGMMNGAKLTPEQIQGLKAGLTQGGNKVDEGVIDTIKDVGKKVKEFINKPIISPTINQKDYQKRVKDKTTHELVGEGSSYGIYKGDGKPKGPMANFGDDKKKKKKSYEEFQQECWKTHKQVGYKKKGGKMVPNCVPKNEEVEITDVKKLSEDDMKGMSVKSGHKRPTKSGAGMTAKGIAAYRRRNPGSKLKGAVTGKVKKGSKAAKRRSSYCARSAGQMKKFPKAAKDPNSRLRQARRRWKC